MSNYTTRQGADEHPEDTLDSQMHDTVKQSGVLSVTSGHFAVTEHNPQNMSIDVAVGRGYVKRANHTHPVRSTTIVNVAVSSNSSGNGRVDAVVMYLDLNATPTADGQNVFKFAVVAGTPAANPVIPDSTAILTAIGAGNPYSVLASILVDSGVSLIADNKITDLRVPAYFVFPGGIKDSDVITSQMIGTYNKVQKISASAGSVVIDTSLGNVIELTVGGNIGLSTPSNIQEGQYIQLDIIQDGTGGRTVNLFSNIYWADGVAPTITTTANKRDSFVFKRISDNPTDTKRFIGYIVSQNIPV